MGQDEMEEEVEEEEEREGDQFGSFDHLPRSLFLAPFPQPYHHHHHHQRVQQTVER